jgi:hypothetical protein
MTDRTSHEATEILNNEKEMKMPRKNSGKRNATGKNVKETSEEEE